MIITRFAPSPTGIMHLGNARTALFSWLFARHNNGRFLLRIEDTDKVRSTDENIQVIKDSLEWLGIDWDGDEVYQSSREARHKEVAQALLDAGKAYYCYTTPEELEEIRKSKKPFRSAWRNGDVASREDVQPVVRFKTGQGDIVIKDAVQGEVTIKAEQLEDMVLLRADGSPTFILAVSVDDYDMGVTHIIRGDDHLVNAFKQTMIFEALGWQTPTFAHVPLIHGASGGKLSKRDGAVGIAEYVEMGVLPEAMRNYLLRLGWSHGDDEIISTEQAIEWFGLEAIGKSPAKFDLKKLMNLNAHYIKQKDNKILLNLVLTHLKARENVDSWFLLEGMDSLKERATTLVELAEASRFYLSPQTPDEKALKILENGGYEMLVEVKTVLQAIENWTEDNIKEAIKELGAKKDMKLGKIAQPIRAILTGSTTSPSVFEIMAIFGKEETLRRFG